MQLVAVTFDVVEPALAATFWAGLLGRDVAVETGGARLVPGDETQVGLRFVAVATEPPGPHRVHLHVTSSSPGDQRDTVTRAIALGGRPIDVGQRPDEGHIVLADPCGVELCVIEPGNTYLAGTGLLGEVACDGTRAVGLFWRDALEWPLVWDRDEETAVQSPHGGTKLAWGGPPIAPKIARNRARFDLAAADPRGEAARLVALGAIELGTARRRHRARRSRRQRVHDQRRGARPPSTMTARSSPGGRSWLRRRARAAMSRREHGRPTAVGVRSEQPDRSWRYRP